MSDLVPLDLDWEDVNPNASTGERIRVTRSGLGITPTELAKETGASPSSVTNWDGGTWPGPFLAKVCETLDVTPEALAAGAPPRVSSGPFFRTQSSKSKVKVLDQATSYCRLVGEAATYFERRQGLALPELPTARNELRDSPEKIARAARKLMKLGKGPIPNVMRAVEQAGVIVVYGERTKIGGRQRVSIDAYSAQVGRWSIMVLTPKGDYYRQRWDVAHEAGHLLLHRDVPDFGEFEDAADSFAAEFLMPRDQIIGFLPAKATRLMTEFRSLKERWGVSIMALVHRSHELGVMSDEDFQQAKAYYNDLRWQSREPGQMVELEQPSLFPRALRSYEEESGVTRLQIVQESGIPGRLFAVMTSSRPPADPDARVHVA